MIKFSIIIVTLNPGNDLNRTVASIKQQTYSNYEIIIKDGGSTDGMIEIYRDSPKIKVYIKKDNGIYDAMNQAIDYVNSDYTIFMNAGDVFKDENVLKDIADAINTENKPVIAYGNAFFKTNEYEILMHPNLTRFVLYRTMICHQAIFFYTNYIKDERYDVSFKISGDYELLIRAIIRDKKTAQYINRTIAVYEGGGFSEKPENIKRNKDERKQVHKMYFSTAERMKFDFVNFISMPKLRLKLYNTNLYQWILSRYRKKGLR